jgi:hypothetical protein
MPSPQHDALVQLFRDRPQLAVEILRDLKGIDLPDTPLIRVENSTFNTRNSDDIEADVVIVQGPPPSPAHVIIIEIQKDKSKDPKQLARYAASAWLQLDCDVTVLVICATTAVAEYYAQPIDSGLTGYRPRAMVLGPGDIPAITDPHEAAAHPELAAMSVMAHGHDRKVLEAFVAALAEVPADHAPKYYDYSLSMSSPAVRRLLEEIMTSTAWPLYSSFAREHYGRGFEEGTAKGKIEGKAEGKIEGKIEGKAEEAARAILVVLTARHLQIPDEARARIGTCTDLAQLETWLTRAATVGTIHELFAEPDGQHG